MAEAYQMPREYAPIEDLHVVLITSNGMTYVGISARNKIAHVHSSVARWAHYMTMLASFHHTEAGVSHVGLSI